MSLSFGLTLFKSRLFSLLALCWEWLYWFLRVSFTEILLFLIGLNPLKASILGWAGVLSWGGRNELKFCLGDRAWSWTFFTSSLARWSSSWVVFFLGESAKLMNVQLLPLVSCILGERSELRCDSYFSVLILDSFDLVLLMKLSAFSMASLLVVFFNRWSFSKHL